ncbi:pyrimidine reductase family protein [Microbacterium sp. SYP-A9085]|jgi:riboflavin biosynthesis pyrimidine reductase|uniref:pyrimidine reductase family protein n=1 Tax=Microbacterium sp. SYP-A9085 TaxID=2664454 RepID=UPI00129B77E3|nr:pyrimidine reductase family protein [Microbacterium sp. SYP-A9085]MRH29377.1 pyrimidine reductase family protein [Microbacterium sp. SYP-A9085]
MPTRDDLFAAYALGDRGIPSLRMNFVASVDGAVSLHGRSGTLGGQTDRALMEVLRAMADVILVGAGTVRVEGYGGVQPTAEDAAWRRTHGLSPAPRLAVVSGRLDLSPDDSVFADATSRPIVVTRASAPHERREALAEVADVLVCGDATVDLGLMVAEFAAQGMTQVLSEGGPHLFGSLLDADVVDELCLTLAPRVVGGGAGRIAQGATEGDRGYALRSILHDDDGFVFLRYAR